MKNADKKFTQGPWEFVSNPNNGALFQVYSNIGGIICTDISDWGNVHDYERAESNARLISSAPELLEALETLTDYIDLKDIPPRMKDCVLGAIRKATK